MRQNSESKNYIYLVKPDNRLTNNHQRDGIKNASFQKSFNDQMIIEVI